MFTATELESYRCRLRALVSRLSRDVSQLTRESHQGTGGEASGGLSDVPIHTADLAGIDEEESTTLGLLENEEHLLAETTAALERLAQSRFGQCNECGKLIARARLQALPYTRWCTACARRQPPTRQ
jgi:RNA polymerase-binding transcription factor DksA